MTARTEVERITIEDDGMWGVNEATDYRCVDCSTPTREVWHEREEA